MFYLDTDTYSHPICLLAKVWIGQGLGLSAAHSVCPGQVTWVSGGNLLCSLLAAGTSGHISPWSKGPKGK